MRGRLSLSMKTTLALVLVNLLAAALIFLQFYLSFWKNISPRFDPEHLAPIKQFLEYRPGDRALPAELATLLAENQLRHVMFDDEGRILAASEGVSAPFFSQSHSWFSEFFRTQATPGKPAVYGFSRYREGVTVQIASDDPVLFYEAMVYRLARHMSVICSVFLVVTLLGNAFILHWSLRPIRRISDEAASIGPQTTSHRLSESGLPTEILPLVRAINLVLDRLEEGYLAQRNFIADAAHELRTPLAVLKAHLDVLDDRQLAGSLQDDLASMERLVSQLLSIAKLDAIQIAEDASVNLSSLAVDVVRHMGPIVFTMDREIEVIGAEHPVWVRGQSDCLFRAMRNLVENALHHGPVGSVITLRLNQSPPEIRVEDQGPGIAPQIREQVFQRFWRGDRDRSHEDGAGLGLAIVSATMKLHGGSIAIGESPGGGAAVRLIFPTHRANMGKNPAEAREHSAPE
ncbi:MAG: HAMP domain-containing histidine kinase [Magnetospirillum sp.]|nr:HAMP domain-containing histidine kinase [Magnetospirillum sp.]